MGENIRENISLPNSDHERRPELTRTISNSSSSSSPFSLDASEELPLCCSHATLGASTEWTNEKHNLYLDSLETSFVNELYHSMHLRDWHQQKNARGTHSLQEVSFKTQNNSDQFMVVQDGCLQTISLRRNETLMESTADSHVTMRSPFRCHYTLAGKSCTVSSPKTLTLKNLHASARSSEQNLVCHQDLVGSITEVSGQNFVDEDHGGKLSNASKPKRLKRVAADVSSNDQVSGQNFVDEDHGGKLSNASKPKRLKRVAADVSSNDQIVPSGNFDTKEVSMAHNVLSEQGHNLRYLLGGS